MENKIKPLPVLAISETVIFPGTIAPVIVAKQESKDVIHLAQNEYGGEIILLAKKNTSSNALGKGLYNIGTTGKIVQFVKINDGSYKLLIESKAKVNVTELDSGKLPIAIKYQLVAEDNVEEHGDVMAAKIAELTSLFREYVNVNPRISAEALSLVEQHKSPILRSHILVSHLRNDLKVKQEILEMMNPVQRIDRIIEIITESLAEFETQIQIRNKVEKQIDKNKRDFYLNEQMRAIQNELGADEKSEIETFERKAKKLKLSKEAKEKVTLEIKKLKGMNPMAAEAGVVKNYLDLILALPWGVKTQTKADISKAQKILDHDHHGLEKVKERIIEYLAVLQRTNKLTGPIICLIGPPGVGKTSLAKSIAEALGRKFSKFALGGLRDEAEIRGHRRTYLGAMPGKFINIIKKSKVSNPLILLDEIDKMSSDYRGDPSSALLEALDPEQNKNFSDHYLEVDYDLSDVMFVATSNSYNLPRPLLDRMEVIDITGYVESEKLQIAKGHLIPKLTELYNLSDKEWQIEDSALIELIRYYTRESGVRDLERRLSALARKTLRKVLDKEIEFQNFQSQDIEKFLGPQKYKFGFADKDNQHGITNGLAYSESGGDLLTIESIIVPGDGKVNLTGKLGEVMQESAQAAFTYFKSKSHEFNVDHKIFKENDIHIHVPEGAVPKDGPSAGIALYTTIASIFSKRKVKADVAMTGEITLRGRVFPIGGLKEKLLAASRGGIKTVIIPKENMKDLVEVPKKILETITIMPVTEANQVIEIALEPDISGSLHAKTDPSASNKISADESNQPTA